MARKADTKVAANNSSGKPTAKAYKAFYSNPKVVSDKFCDRIQALEQEMKMRAILLWHGGSLRDPFAYMNEQNYLMFLKKIERLERDKPVAAVIYSPGGDARAAYKLATLLRKHCGGFVAVVPHYAKSAATLFTLGADRIVMSRCAEMGPLDVQIEDPEREQRLSGLEVVQAIERLNGEAMRAIDQQMALLLMRAGKKIDTLLPIVTHFVSEMMRPLFEKIDTVNYTAMARALKVAQDYAERLLMATGAVEDPKEVANTLTNAYADHGYVVDCDELKGIGMKNVEEATGNLGTILESLAFMECESTILGPLMEK